MTLQIVVGSGPIGSATAKLLAGQGYTVRVITRSGTGPKISGIERIAVDAKNTEHILEVGSGAQAIYNCANPPYNRWLTDWPPLATSLLRAAERTGAVLVTMSNLYGYGEIDHPITERDPLQATSVKGEVRADMWKQMLEAYETGRAKVVEARASDYFGPGVGKQSHMGGEVIARILKGKTVSVFGNPDAPHSWTYVSDIASTLVTLGSDKRSWGRAWHVPTNPPMSQREIITAMANIARVRVPNVRSYSPLQLRMAGLFIPFVRELDEVRYQFDRPFVIDSSDFETTFGVRPTQMDEALRATVSWQINQPKATMGAN